MESALETPRLVQPPPLSLNEAWVSVTSLLRGEMQKGLYITWVEPLQPLSFKDGLFRVGCANRATRDWVKDHLNSKIEKLLESIYMRPVSLSLTIWTRADEIVEPAAPGVGERTGKTAAKSKPAKNGRIEPEDSPEEEARPASPRKIQLQRAYGTERARVVQPERGMFLTMYFLNKWLPLVGHSAMTVIMAARALCYWNVKTGEMRNVIETDMSELARRASVSVRTVKEVLNAPLVKQYFLRYKVRRVMTSNGVRTAGIVLFVRMDEPVTPEDQQENGILEEEHWYTADFDDEQD